MSFALSQRRTDRHPVGLLVVVGLHVMRWMAALETHAVSHGTLRVHVHDEGLQPSSSERGRKVDGGRRLSNSTLLTDDSEHMPHGYGSVSSRAARGSVPLRKSSRVCWACRTQRSDSAPDGGCFRNASRC